MAMIRSHRYKLWKTNGMSGDSNRDLSLLPAEIETGLYYWTDKLQDSRFIVHSLKGNQIKQRVLSKPCNISVSECRNNPIPPLRNLKSKENTVESGPRR